MSEGKRAPKPSLKARESAGLDTHDFGSEEGLYTKKKNTSRAASLEEKVATHTWETR